LLQQLAAQGAGPGARIGVLMRNRWEYVVAMFAIARAGCVAVHLPARFAQGELDYALQKIPLQMLLLDAGLPLQAPGQPGVVCVPADLGAEADAAFSALLACKAKLPQIPPVQADTPGAIMFTSGTTGRPKGAIQPVDGRDLSLRIAQSDFQLHQRDVLVVASPLYVYNLPYLGLIALELVRTQVPECCRTHPHVPKSQAAIP
jgi:fatty-acyl-CoA synthase